MDDADIEAVLTDEEKDEILTDVRSQSLMKLDDHIWRVKREWSKDYPPDDHFTALVDSIKSFANAMGDVDFAASIVARTESKVTEAVSVMNEDFEPTSTSSATMGTSSTKSTALGNLFRDVDE